MYVPHVNFQPVRLRYTCATSFINNQVALRKYITGATLDTQMIYHECSRVIHMAANVLHKNKQ